MLIDFKVKNFLSFRDEQTFSMVASSDKSHLENIFTNGAFTQYKLLNFAGIYGANASGKTNIIKALRFVEGFVSHSHEQKIGSRIDFRPFLLDEVSSEKPTNFEITFIHKGVRYDYGFILTTSKIIEEWLFAYPSGRPQKWFIRNEKLQDENSDGSEYDWDFGKNLKGENNSIASQTRSNVLFLSKAADQNHRQLSIVYNWFDSCLDTYTKVQNIPPVITAKLIKNNTRLKEQVTSLFNQSDLGIVDFESIEKQVSQEDFPDGMPENLRKFLSDTTQLQITLSHRTSQPTVTRSFPLGDESKGTEVLFALGGIIFEALNEGKVLILDEIDSSLHPNLVKAIIRLFQDPRINKNNAQLIFNTHDTTLLDLEGLFRRDQIWFVEKDSEGASHLYPLSDFNPRKGEAIQKNYLQGRYGATPTIGTLLQPV